MTARRGWRGARAESAATFRSRGDRWTAAKFSTFIASFKSGGSARISAVRRRWTKRKRSVSRDMRRCAPAMNGSGRSWPRRFTSESGFAHGKIRNERSEKQNARRGPGLYLNSLLLLVLSVDVARSRHVVLSHVVARSWQSCREDGCDLRVAAVAADHDQHRQAAARLAEASIVLAYASKLVEQVITATKSLEFQFGKSCCLAGAIGEISCRCHNRRGS
jgi:hypothetical protein